MEYQVIIHKTITFSIMVEANNSKDAAIIGKALISLDNENGFIEDTKYSPAEVYELEEKESNK
jgi:hypothetical protein